MLSAPRRRLTAASREPYRPTKRIQIFSDTAPDPERMQDARAAWRSARRPVGTSHRPRDARSARTLVSSTLARGLSLRNRLSSAAKQMSASVTLSPTRYSRPDDKAWLIPVAYAANP